MARRSEKTEAASKRSSNTVALSTQRPGNDCGALTLHVSLPVRHVKMVTTIDL
jgi:hypothetical protein